MAITRLPGRTYNQDHVPRKYTPRQAAGEHLLDLELPVGGQPEPRGAGQPLLDHDRGAAGGLAGVRGDRVGRDELPPGDRGDAGAVPSVHARLPEGGGGGDRSSGRRVPAHRPGRLPAADRRADPGGHRYAAGLRAGPSRLGAGGVGGGDRGDPGVAQARGHLPADRPAPRRRLHGRHAAAPDGVQASRRRAGAEAAAVRPVHPVPDEGARRAGA